MSGFETGNKLKTGPRGEPLTRTSITTYTLKILDLADPQPDAICMEDIAHGLSQHVRWAGQGRWLTVAQHSVMVMRMIEEYGRAWHFPTDKRMLRRALMHDAHEAYIGDLSGGLKYLLRDSMLKELIFRLDHAIEHAIPHLDFDDIGQEQEAIDWAEELLVPAEYGLLFRGKDSKWIEGPHCPQMSEALFLQEAERLDMFDGGQQ